MRTITDRHGVTWTVSERPAPAGGARATDEPGRLRRAVGARVRELRRTHGRMSQERLAFHAGFDPSFVGRLERGETGVTVETIAVICRALGVTLRGFFEPLDRTYAVRGPRRRRREGRS